MRYRSKKTGAVIEVQAEITGKGWEALTAPPTGEKPKKEKKTKKV